ncbi:MAG: hypothetical protein COU69_03770 [Candidatus Pacebacteria bacterium CG10_big_fil_rev_8_21_14_0_10_56_10]|nr:MAG: hypothetical protein COU69_03770 [Candidatus Pacebacteria bacterium CG10_big_fil_rev_8_21_14_0_10_56_10]
MSPFSSATSDIRVPSRHLFDRSIFPALRDWLFPATCCHCGTYGRFLCANCYQLTTFEPLPVRLALDPLHLSQVIAMAKYAGPIKSMVIRMKYGQVKAVAADLAHLLYWTTAIPTADIITAVPMHPSKQRRRGFNQAELVAKALGTHLRIPYQPLLRKTIATAPQAKAVSRAARLKHLRHSFALNTDRSVVPAKPTESEQPRVPTKPSTDSSVLLVDDIVTTGTTLNECARLLKNAGYRRVFGLTLAHGR